MTLHRRPLPALTGVRFFAAMYVVLFHFGAGFALRHRAPGAIQLFLGHGYAAVSLFFVLSGFILAYIYEGQIEGPSYRIRFWQARFARIYPVYLLSLLASLGTSAALSPAAAAACLGMVQAWIPGHPGLATAWNLTAWTLSVESFFYLCFPFLLARLSQAKPRTIYPSALLWAALSVLIGTTQAQSDQWQPLLPILALLPVPLLRLPEFVLGICAGLIFLERQSAPRTHSGRRILLVYAASCAAILLLCLPIGRWISLVVPVFALLIYELAKGDNRLARLLSMKIMTLLGGASYAIYLLQMPVRFWMRRLFLNLPASVSALDAFLSPIALIALSMLVFFCFEEPSRRALRRWFARLDARTGTRKQPPSPSKLSA